MPQVSVMPANTSPEPTKAGNAIQAGSRSQAAALPSATRVPAAMRTCRSRLMAVPSPRRTG